MRDCHVPPGGLARARIGLGGAVGRTARCRGFVCESVVDLRDRLLEEMLREWWDTVGFEDEDGF